MEEVWRDIPGYIGLYKVSSHGRVKSLDRINKYKWKGVIDVNRFLKGKILATQYDKDGYPTVALNKNNVGTSYNIHRLVAMAFLGHTPDGHKLVVDHIDNNKVNNHVENLQLVSARVNTSKNKDGNFSSEYVGVYSGKSIDSYYASIRINGDKVFLGSFTDEKEAARAYQNKLKEIGEVYIDIK